VGYEFGNIRWKPKLSYRYAFFEGDDPDTGASEAFDPLLPGFHDWAAGGRERSAASTSFRTPT
jgi:hypothetical protein